MSVCDNFDKYEPILMILYCCILQWAAKEAILSNPTAHLKSVAALPCEI